MAEIVSTIATTIFDHSLGVIGRQFGYLWNYKKNVDTLKVQVEKLDKERGDKTYRVTVAKRNAERIRDGVTSWQTDADKISEEAKEILLECEEKGKKRCLMTLSPNLISRYQFGRRACKKRIEVEQAISKADQIKEVSDRVVGQGITSSLSMKGVFTFDSRKSTLEDIMKTLQDETKNIIGVYGFGGMGKTTLAKQVASRAAEEKMFEEVVMGSVTETVDMKEIQGQIASMLGLNLLEISVAERACRIHERLKGKKVLIILDDLWKKLDLKEVGIPFGADHKGCKMLLTSRFLPVLASMGIDKEFLLGALKEEEAWRLFEEKIINVVRKPAFLTIGKEVAKRCAGLPVLIVAVAASLSRQQDLNVWKDALTQLKKMNNKQMHEIVNSAMKTISYNHLGQRHKQLFLLCGIVGGDVYIEHLLQYSWGWGFFDGEVATMGEARNRLHAWILDLKESCLLLDGYSGTSIKMHDVVRDVAISIAKKDLNMFSIGENDAELNIWHKDGGLKRCSAIIFRGCPMVSCLPQQLECSSLELCILSGFSGNSSLEIPNTFFEKTTNLKVLDMSQLYFSALPSSLSFMKNLQTLRVDNCYNLKEASIVGELKKLQTLSFANSQIAELPSEIGLLSELRLLNLNRCSQLKVIPAGLITGLFQLEELYMSKSFDRWEAEECLISSGRRNASLLELKRLPNLNNLEITLPDAKFLSEDLNFEKWEKYEIFVGEISSWWRLRSWLDGLEIARKVYLRLNSTSINKLLHGIKRLFKRAECVWLNEFKGIKNVIPELDEDEDGFSDLKHLRIKQDYDIEYIVNVDKRQHKASFPALESLQLSHLLKLQRISNGRLMEESFYNLTIVKVTNCKRLESLFSFSMAVGLGCLQEVQVSKCSVLEEIVAENNKENDDVRTEDGVCEKIEFAQLRKLSLRVLPKLNNFFSNGKKLPMQKEGQNSLTTDMESEEIISEEVEFKSSVPFFEKVSFPKLEELNLFQISNLSEIWNYKLLETYCNLTKLEIERCDNLKYLLTPSISKGLVGLHQLIITSCAEMKNIVAKEEGETKIETICFPQLSYLHLASLPNLTTFYSSLVEEIDPNENLDTDIQPLFNEKVSFPKLEELKLSNISNLFEIWNYKLSETYCNLTKLEIERCDNLKYLLTFSITKGLVGLRQLIITSCVKMKNIVAKEEGETKIERICFPQLSYLRLASLPNLTTFYPSLVEQIGPNENLDTVIQPLFNEKISLPKMETLELSAISNLTEIWSHQVQEMPCCNLTRLTVRNCDNLKYLLTPYLTKGLVELQQLTIQSCARMKQIVVKGEGESKMGTINFPQLSYIRLYYLSNLTTFYGGIEEMDANENLEASVQPLFNEKVKFPNLKQLEICNLDGIKTIWPNMPRRGQYPPEIFNFQTLQRVEVDGCQSLEYVIPAAMAGSLNQLEDLRIKDCGLETIMGTNKDTELEEIKAGEVAMAFAFPKLVKFNLKSLSKLKCFYPREYTTDCPALEELEVCDCDKIQPCMFPLFSIEKVAFPSSMNFKNMLEMKINGCVGLKYLFTPSVATGLERVRKLTITKCSMMRAIVGNEGGEGTIDGIAFPQLIHLSLDDLPNLARFYSRVKDMDSNGKLDHDVQPLFDEKIHFSRLEQLSIAGLDNINTIWQTQQFFQVDSFSKLQVITVKSCANLVKVFSSTVSTRTHVNLKKESQEFFSFQNLRNVMVRECKSLKCVFPVSVAQSLNKLEYLNIQVCEVLETIVGGENYMESSDEILKAADQLATIFEFPKLTDLKLKRLPKVECFFPRKHITECPVLKVLNVHDCDRVSALDFLSIQEKQGDEPFEKVISNLERLSITSRDVIKILRVYGHFPPYLFSSLKTLTITEFHCESAVFPSKFISMVRNQLQTFRICNCSFQEIFPNEGEAIDHTDDDILLPQLKELKLEKLPELSYICKQDEYSFIPDILGRLETLDVVECPLLKELVPFSVSFRLLNDLTISNCGGLINLIHPSTARSLEQLEWLTIKGCLMIEEIIGGEVSDDVQGSSSFDDEIIFNKLENLELDNLPRLTSFCSSRSYTFNFPKLDWVHVIECPNMKTFCGGTTTTPKLNEVYLNESYEERWEEDLNTTVQQIFAGASASNPEKESNVCENSTESRIGTEICEEVVEEGKDVVMTTQPYICEEVVEEGKDVVMTTQPDICEKGEGKELEVSEEVFKQSTKLQEIPQEQTLAWSLAYQHLAASSSLPIPPTSNTPNEVSPTLAVTAPTTSSNNRSEVEGEIQDKSVEKLTNESIHEGVAGGKVTDTCEKGKEKEFEVCEDLVEPRNNGETWNQSEVSPCLVSEAGTSIAASNSHQKDFQGLCGSKDIISSLSESFQILQAQDMKSISAEQVLFMEDASEWFCGYVRQARECVEQNKVISELELKIAETEAQLQALQEKKRAAEDKYEATAATMPRCG